MNREQLAVKVLKATVKHPPSAILYGDVTAMDLVRLALSHITHCPECGESPSIDSGCPVCMTVSFIEKMERLGLGEP